MPYFRASWAFRTRQIMLVFLCGLSAFGVHAQSEPWRNQILNDQIKSVTFHRVREPLTTPIMLLGVKNDSIRMEFDVMGDENYDFIYRIEHCDSDWKRSDLNTDEYILGFNEARIRDFNPSVNTVAVYNHYALQLPNSDMEITKSGNYRLIVLDNSGEEPVEILKLRFFVAEPNAWEIAAQFVRPADASKDRTHHELDFEVDTKNFRVVSPRTEMKAFVVQNNRFDRVIGPLIPRVSRGSVQVYDLQDSVIFPAGKESRIFDTRTYDFRKQNVEKIQRARDYYEVALRVERDRKESGVNNFMDADGGFILANETPNQEFLESDYAKVLFRLEKKQEIEDAGVYIIGRLNDYTISEQYRMDYSAAGSVYFKELMLKQGYYNYEFAVVRGGQITADPELSVEGNFYESKNLYQIYVYYRSVNDRYDRLMCTRGFKNP
jgi:Domain of unknown function (DUF5103)